jgi:hypothetical protein
MRECLHSGALAGAQGGMQGGCCQAGGGRRDIIVSIVVIVIVIIIVTTIHVWTPISGLWKGHHHIHNNSIDLLQLTF